LLVWMTRKSMRSLLRLNLATYEVVETGEPEQALALGLEHKLTRSSWIWRMPKYSGFECAKRTSFSATQLIPVIVISGEAGSNTRDL